MQTTTKIKLPPGELTNYLLNQEERYGRIYRFVYRTMIDENYHNNFESDSDLRNFIVKKFGITSRLSFTIVSEIKGRLKALREQNKYLLQVLRNEIYQLKKEIEKLEKQVESLKEKARENRITEKELLRLRNKKKRLYALRNKLNKKKQKQENIRKNLKEGKPFRIGFGSRRLFKKQFHLKENGYKSHQEWYEDYIYFRDHNIASLGSAAETSGNQLSTLFYNNENGTFSLRFRKFDSGLKGKEKHLFVENIKIPYLTKEIKDIVTKKVLKPLYHRFVRERNGYYLHVSFDLNCPKTKEAGYKGFCGLDYNDGFIELAASDLKGNLVFQKHLNLEFHGSGNKAKTEILQKISEIVSLCRDNNWELIVEDLDFKNSKARMLKGKSKGERKFNKIIHDLDYHR